MAHAEPLNLEGWLSQLESAHPTSIDLGLERVAEVWHRLGAPRPASRVVVVAGTNGKGSTVAMLEQLAICAGLRVGTTTSPHLRRFNERIRVHGVDVADADIVAAFEQIERARDGISLTYFEFSILGALWIMAGADLDLAVLEVGLGGRLDAVNIIDADLAIVTAIGLDHQAWLGDDRESIGAEKVAVARAGAPLIIADRDPPASVLTASEFCPVYRIGREFELNDSEASQANARFQPMCTDLRGACVAFPDLPAPALPPDSVAAALQAAVLLDAVPESLECIGSTRLEGRLDLRCVQGIPVVLDVAHNAHAAAHLARCLESRAPMIGVLGTYVDKCVEDMVDALTGIVDEWVLVPTVGARGQSAEVLAARLEGNHRTCASVEEGVQWSLARAHALGRQVLVCGSFCTVGPALDACEALETSQQRVQA